MTAVVRRLACAALGLTVARIVAGAVPGGRRVAAGIGALAWLSVALASVLAVREGGRVERTARAAPEAGPASPEPTREPEAAPQAPPRRPPTLAVLLARGADF